MKIRSIIILLIVLCSCDDPMSGDTPRDIEIIDGASDKLMINTITLIIDGVEYSSKFGEAYIENNLLKVNSFNSNNQDINQILEKLLISKLQYDLENEITILKNGFFIRRDYLGTINIDRDNNLSFNLNELTNNKIEFNINIKLEFPRTYTESGTLILEY